MSKTVDAQPLFTLDPKRYTSREYHDKEKQRLWPKTWQVACREEELPTPGEYVTYTIADDSVIIMRTKNGEIAAYHNVCPHRGRRLTTNSCGVAKQFRCGYHGWTFDTDGKNILVLDRDDWMGALDGEQLDLKHVRIDTWGGFVFVDFRKDGETLAEFLETVPQNLGPYEYEKMRYRWYVTVHVPCNWKAAIEAFAEGYHVAATHPQLLPIFGDDYTNSYAQGRHSLFKYERGLTPLATPSPRLDRPIPADGRRNVMEFFEVYERDMKALFSERDYEASLGLMQALPEPADAMTAFGAAVELGRRAAEVDGVGYPEGATYEHMAAAGADWHVFPNFVTLPWFDGALCYRARPDGDDPDKAIMDIWSLVRYAPGKAPPLERRVIKDSSAESINPIFDQDLSNMHAVQQGMKSSAFTKCRPNPVQEVPLINFHRTLDEYIGE